jgi:hypothetical protein
MGPGRSVDFVETLPNSEALVELGVNNWMTYRELWVNLGDAGLREAAYRGE